MNSALQTGAIALDALRASGIRGMVACHRPNIGERLASIGLGGDAGRIIHAVATVIARAPAKSAIRPR